MKILIRPMYSSPPVHGARIVAEILGDAKLRAQWYGECRSMAGRIAEMRTLLRKSLAEAGSSRDWSHITSQIGMFCFSGMTPEQVRSVRALIGFGDKTDEADDDNNDSATP